MEVSPPESLIPFPKLMRQQQRMRHLFIGGLFHVCITCASLVVGVLGRLISTSCGVLEGLMTEGLSLEGAALASGVPLERITELRSSSSVLDGGTSVIVVCFRWVAGGLVRGGVEDD